MMTRALPEGSFLPSRRPPFVACIATASGPFLTWVLLSCDRSLQGGGHDGEPQRVPQTVQSCAVEPPRIVSSHAAKVKRRHED